MLIERIVNDHKTQAEVAAGTLIFTFLAHLGRHQDIHYQIANVAMTIETTAFVAALLSEGLKDRVPQLSRILGWAAVTSLILTGACYGAVVLTDVNYALYFAHDHGITNPFDLYNFTTQELLPDFTRDVANGVKQLSGQP